MVTGCQHSLGNMPTVTRTGELKDITILETVSPGVVTVNPGTRFDGSISGRALFA